MSAHDSWHPPGPDAVGVGRDVLLVLVGLVVGAIVGLVIAGYAGWIPPLNMC